MEERHAAQRAQKKEFERERAAVDEIVRKIHEEDHAELVRKKQKQEATKKYIREFMLDREKMRMAQRAAQQAEEDEIRAYNDAVAARQAGLAAKEKAKVLCSVSLPCFGPSLAWAVAMCNARVLGVWMSPGWCESVQLRAARRSREKVAVVERCDGWCGGCVGRLGTRRMKRRAYWRRL
jgi:hypothetical protein